ncbi:MAG TPA: TonB-dependent receptor plug domain-containing protein, partial [Candidatus Eisenbacteria bacterium]|nr:TonB-dependent receptor plug domain-containing protein [Candidatus Eisenbacteria bacterium]
MLAGTVLTALGAISPATAVEVVVVTGSRIPQSNLTSTAPLSVRSAAQIEMTAAYSVEDVLRTMTGTDLLGLSNNANNGGVGLSTASLHGLGTSRTLVLIDGQRLVPVFVGSVSVPDLNSVPVSLVDHIEVLRDGASSVYGADAIGGVINIITKKDFAGLQFNADAGISEHGGGDSYALGATLGVDLSRGNVTVSIRHEATGAIGQWQRGWSSVFEVGGVRGSILRGQLPTLQDENSNDIWVNGALDSNTNAGVVANVPCTAFSGGLVRL